MSFWIPIALVLSEQPDEHMNARMVPKEGERTIIKPAKTRATSKGARFQKSSHTIHRSHYEITEPSDEKIGLLFLRSDLLKNAFIQYL